MRKLAILFLALTLCFPWLAKMGISVDFVLRQDQIAQTACENRNRPELHCEGRCVLMKKLNLLEESDQPAPLPSLAQWDIAFYTFSNSNFDLSSQAGKEIQSVFASPKCFFKSVYLPSVFQPPRVLV